MKRTHQPVRRPARRPTLGIGLVGLGAFLFIVNAGVSRVVLRAGVTPSELTTVRITGTAVVLLLAALVVRREALRPPTGGLRWLLLVHGLVGVAALHWTYFVAIDRLPVGLALLLEYQAPVLVALWARFVQREAVRRRVWFGLGLALLGLALSTGVVSATLGGEGLRFDGLGLLAGAAAAVCFATYFLVGERGVAEVEPIRVVLWSFAIGAVAMNLVEPVWQFPTGVLHDSVPMLGNLSGMAAPGFVLVAWVVLLGTLVPFGVELAALQHVSASTVTVVAMVEPVGVTVLGYLWFEETLGVAGVLGCVLVVAGILAAQTARSPRPEPPLPAA